MIRPAFSTVACPDWTLAQVATRSATVGFEAVELRSFGDGSRAFACDPALSDEAKVRATFREAGIEIASLATGLRFDQMVTPPVLGYLKPDFDRSAREGKRAVDLAVALECPLVRLFGFHYPEREKKASAFKRIGARLATVADHADKTGVRVVVENGGSFGSAAALRELLDSIAHPMLGASYSSATGVQAGDDPARAVELLGDRLWLARVKDADMSGRPTTLGRGVLQAEAFVRALVERGFSGPVVYEWDRAWISDPPLAAPEQALPPNAQVLAQWLAPGRSTARNVGAGAR